MSIMEFKDGKVARETQYFGDERGQVIYDPGVTLVETWQALECLVDEGQCKTIGLSISIWRNCKRLLKPRESSRRS